jgi:hypothetical protein
MSDFASERQQIEVEKLYATGEYHILDSESRGDDIVLIGVRNGKRWLITADGTVTEKSLVCAGS